VNLLRNRRGVYLLRLVKTVLLLIAVSLVSLPNIAKAQTNGNSSSFGAFVDLTFVPLLGGDVDLDLGPLPTASGSAVDPNTYSDTDTVLSASVSLPALGSILSTGVLTVNADGDLANDTTSADATVDDLEILIVGTLQLLTITADTVVSTADISGECGVSGLTATGTTTIEGAGVGGTLGVGLSIDASPPPNTVLLDLLGVRVVLNEQIVSGDGVNSRGITVNAIHVDLTNTILTLIGALSGDIIIAQSQAQVLCDEVEGEADLSITKVGVPDPVTVGNTLTYTLTVANGGPADATGVVVTDTLPSSFILGPVNPSQGSCGNVGNTVTCSLGTIANGSNATITIEVTPTQAGIISNTAVVAGDQPDPDPSDNSDTETTTVEGTGEPSANLSITKSGSPNPVIVNQQLTYTVTVTNIGPDSATNVVVTDTLPAGAIFGSATPDQGSCNEALGVVTCNLGTITAGNSVIITIIITPTVVGTASNNVTVVSDVDDPDPGDNSDDEDTDVDPAPPGPTPTGPPPSDPASPSPPGGGTVNSIPTLSGWASIAMPLLLVLISIAVLRRRASRNTGGV
jgi:uncharacterized repeat protein (TIGR01451 family)